MSPQIILDSSKTLGPIITICPTMALPKAIMMVDPRFFEIVDAINPHMKNPEGNLRCIDKASARSQWEALLATYSALGYPVHVCPAIPGLPDMVFCANQSLPFLNLNGKRIAYLGTMFSSTRKPEVIHIESFLKKLAMETVVDWGPMDQPFEGTGDALWVPGRRFLLGGHGFRSGPGVYTPLVQKMGVHVALFELLNPKFYHLDTCLSVLREDTVLAYKGAFTETGWKHLESLFPNVIETRLQEADSPGFACNAHCPDGRHVLIQKGNHYTEKSLLEHGFIPIPLETSEFVKSGGSVFCMKLALW